jgi:CRISPR-associated protein Csd2
MSIKNRIDFKVILEVSNANPNGNPTDNRPNHFSDFTGYITPMAIKHKIRMLADQMGASILLTNLPDNNGMRAIHNKLNNKIRDVLNSDDYIKAVCGEYFDVRAFGAAIPMKKEMGNSIAITGPVTINQVCSVDQIEIVSAGITRSYNMKDEEGMESSRYGFDTFFVRYGLYILNGSISASLSEKTGFNNMDAKLLKASLLNLFDNDVSNSRPAGSINVRKLIWWEHSDKHGNYKVKDVFDSVIVSKLKDVNAPLKYSDYKVDIKELDGLSMEIY